MKKMNKKGFTLIELLAVIIILGILMIIAIPSVTSYIQNSRKSAYIDTAVGYMDAVMKEVNASKDLRFYSTDTLYLVSVGHDKKNSCVSVESGGQSPFSDEWKYAYVGVTYDGKGYSYYFIAEDAAGQGISFLDKKTLSDDGTEYLYSQHKKSSQAEPAADHTAKGQDTMNDPLATNLAKWYKAGSVNDTEFTEVEGEGVTAIKTSSPSIDYSTVFVDYIVGAGNDYKGAEQDQGKTINNIVIISKNDAAVKCYYKEDLSASN